TVDEAERMRLGRAHEAPGEEQILDDGRSGEVDQTAAGGAGETVAEGSGDRDAERRLRCRHAQIAGQRNRASAAGRDALQLRDRRLGDALEPIEDLVEPPLVRAAVLGAAEGRKLRDV